MRRAARVLTAGAAFVLLAAPLPAQQDDAVILASMPQEKVAIDAGAARAAIEKSNEQWLAAFRAGDSETLASIYTPDASLFPPGEAILEGPSQIVGYLEGERSLGMQPPVMSTSDVVIMGTNAYEVGTYRFSYSGEQPRDDAGKYFAIWKVQADGSWRYHVGILTSAASRN